MDLAAALLLGLCLGAGGVWWLLRDAHLGELVYLRKELAQATDRLVHAWHEKAVIPPRPVDPVPIEPLPPQLRELVEEWENPDLRRSLEDRYRGRLASGWTVDAILRHAEDEHPDP